MFTFNQLSSLTVQENCGAEDDSKEDCFSSKDVEILFGENSTLDEVFSKLDVDKNGAVSLPRNKIFLQYFIIKKHYLQSKLNNFKKITEKLIKNYSQNLLVLLAGCS